MKTQMEMDQELKLGIEVMDLTSGLKGTLDAKQYNLYSGMKVSIQPKGDGSELKTGWTVDAVGVKVLDLTPIVEGLVEPKEVIKLGERVRCSVTEFEGVAVSRKIFLNGCTRIQIQEKYKKDGMVQQEPANIWQDEPALEVIKPKKADPAPKPAAQNTGGPSLSSDNRSRNVLNTLMGRN